MGGTEEAAYTRRLAALGDRRWKQVLDVQVPYRWQLRRTHPGRTLDVGCGLGRDLRALDVGVGVDHNPDSVAIAKARGYQAWTTTEWPTCPDALPASFDTILLSHVLEHLDADSATQIVQSYLPYLKVGGQLVLVCPQERGYASDATHVRFLDAGALRSLALDLGFRTATSRSFPFPRFVGRLFTYNETWLVARRG
ncbi:MAG: methyltransferase domain-containing protein [Actinomycetes bacterium]